MLKEAAFVCLMTAGLTAQAQVFKCTNPRTGAVTFSDRRCDTAEKEVHLLNKVDGYRLMLEQRDTRAAQYRLARDKADIAAKEAQERASAGFIGGGAGGGWDCKNAHKNAATMTSSLTFQKKASQQAYLEELQKADSKCGTGESYATAAQREKMAEAAKPRPLPPPPPPPIPDSNSSDRWRTIRQCNLGTCQDDKGESYRFTGPQQMTNTWTGQTCTIDKLSGTCK